MIKKFRKLKKSFTLAEILITLTIIGVVASLSIPTLTRNIEKQKTVVALQKAYAEFNQAVERAKSEYGDIQTWDFSLNSVEFFDKYLNSYLIIKSLTREEFNEQNEIKYYEISGKEEKSFAIFRFGDGRFITLPSGAHVMQTEHNYYGKSFGRKGFIIDINGIAKPNTFGKDVFSFLILEENGKVLPHYFDDQEEYKPMPNREKLKNGKSSYNYQCNKSGRGLWCGALIFLDGWKIADDYPW